MYTLKGKLIGIAPILFERLLEEAQEQIADRKSAPALTREEKIEQAYRKVYRRDGVIGVPAQNVKRCLLRGSQMKKQKRQRSSLWPYLEGAAFFTEDFLSLGVEGPELIHEETGRVPPGKKGTPTQIFRPALRVGWELPFELSVYEDTIAATEVREALEYAGLMVGLCGHRPEYGRFRVEWEDGDGQRPA